MDKDATIRLLEQELSRVKQENERLREELARKDKEIEELKLQLEIFTHPAESKAKPTYAKPNRSHRRKKSGRNKGHEGKGRPLPEHIDEHKILDQTECPKCGNNLSEPVDKYIRVVEDIIPAKVHVTEYTEIIRYCRVCRNKVTPQPQNVLPKARFGLTLMVLVVTLKMQGLSLEKIRALLTSWFSLNICEAELYNIVIKIAKEFGSFYKQLVKELRQAEQVNGDETSWRIDGKNYWLWTFVNKWTQVFVIDRSRGKKVPRRILSKKFRGVLGSDFWSAWNFAKGAKQKCLIHLLREIEKTIEHKNPGQEFLHFARKLKRIINDAIRLHKSNASKEEKLASKFKFEKRITKLLSCHYTETNCTRLCKTLRREQDNLFTFLAIEGVDWNNNIAERALRPSVIIRKITNGNRSEAGANAHAVLMSVIGTCKLRQQNFAKFAMNHLSHMGTTSKD